MKLLLLLLTSLASLSIAASENLPPKVRIIKNTCPGEFCKFRNSGAHRDLELLDEVNGTKIIGTIKKDEVVKALTGEQHISPTPVEIVFNHGKFKVGQRIFLLYGDRYEGAQWGIWANGKTTEEVDVGDALIPKDLAPYSEVTRVCRKPSKKCWGRLLEERVENWWTKVQLHNGKVGWVKNGEFDNTSSEDPELPF